MSLKRNLFLSGTMMLALAISNVAVGQIFDGGGSNPGDWNDPLNWDTDFVPSGTDSVFVGDDLEVLTATANITADVPDYGDLRVGFGTGFASNGTVNHSAGTANAGGWVFMGVDNIDTSTVNVGTYNLSGTAVWNTANTFLGTAGGVDGITTAEGYLNISDSAALNTGSLNVGNNDDNLGVVTQTGGTVTIGDNADGAAWLNVGDNVSGNGVYNMTGGNLISEQTSIGQTGGATGQINLSGNASLTQLDPTQGLRVGRGVIPDQTDLNFAQGSLSITGGGVSVSATNLSVGGDETGTVSATPTPSTSPAEGTLSFTSELNAISSISVSGNVLLNDGSVSGFADLVVDFETSPVVGDVVLIDLSSAGTVTGAFQGLAEGAAVSGSGGRTLTYMHGPDSNDIALIAASVGFAGDFDNSGTVGNDDLTLLLDGWGGAPGAGWTNNPPETVGNTSLTLLLDDWGKPLTPALGAASVPEPSCLAIAMLATMSGLAVRRSAWRCRR